MISLTYNFITNSSTTVSIIYWKPFKQFDKDKILAFVRQKLNQNSMKSLLDEYSDYDLDLDNWTQKDFDEFRELVESVITKLEHADLFVADNDLRFPEVVAADLVANLIREFQDDAIGCEYYEVH